MSVEQDTEAGSSEPAYRSDIPVRDQDPEERGGRERAGNGNGLPGQRFLSERGARHHERSASAAERSWQR